MLSPSSCSVCHLQSCQTTPVGPCRRCKRDVCPKCCSSLQIYQKVGSKVQLSTCTVCEGCKSEQIQLRLFKETNKLKFATSSSIGHRLLKFISQSSAQSLSAQYRDAQNVRKARENQQIYQRLKTKINQEKLYTKNNLSHPLVELYSMVTSDIRQQQQHERIKNLLMALVLNKPINCLQNIAEMVLFFLLFLNQQETYHIVAKLYKNYVPSVIYLNRQDEIQQLKQDFEQRISEQKIEVPYGSPEAYIDCWKSLTINKLNPELSFMVLEQLFGHKNQLQQYFNNIMVRLIKQCDKGGYDNAKIKLLRVQPFGIKTSSTLKQSLSSPEQPVKVKDANTVTNENSLLRKIVQKLVLEQDDILNDVRNQYLLIVELLRKQEEQMLIVEQKFQKQKDDLLDKIVKLNNQLEDHKADMENIKKEKQQSEKTYQEQIQILQQKIQKLLASSNVSTSQEGESTFNLELISRSERKKLITSLAGSLDYYKLPTMITLEDTVKAQKQLINSVHSHIAQLQTQIQNLLISESNLKHTLHSNQKANRLQIQTRKLLQIIAKKQERFVLEIHQKDAIIECYQNILWHIQNNIELPGDNNISIRVSKIMKNFNKGKKGRDQKEKDKDKDKEKECLLF